MTKRNKMGSSRQNTAGYGSRGPVYLVGGIVSLILVVFGAAVFADSRTNTQLPGKEVETLGNEHIGSTDAPPKAYNTDPPTSGPHAGSLAPWGVNAEPIPDELQVHNLEDGGIAVQYGSGVPDEEVDKLGDIVRDYDRVLLAPRSSLPENQIAITAWGRILKLEEVREKQIRDFIDAYEGIDHHAGG